MSLPLLQLEDLEVTFRVPDITGRSRRLVHAVRGVSLFVEQGEVLGVVGESGSGKSTLVRAVVGLAPVTGGAVRVAGQTLQSRPGIAARHGVQMVFQDHASTLNPFQTVSRILDDVMLLSGTGVDRRTRRLAAESLLRRVGMGPEAMDRRANSFSGGQRQRISIARSLAASPRLLICDEPTSALDVSIQAQILELLTELKAGGLSLVFISHNLAVVRQMADRIAVMYAGRVLEEGPASALVCAPAHPYTGALVAAAPTLADRGALLKQARNDEGGGGPAPVDGAGDEACPYIARCPRRDEPCLRTPTMTPAAHGGRVRCHFPLTAPAATATGA